MKNFWFKLKKPIFALAPMAGYTDSAFRQICKKFGADVVYSEMASVEALVHNPKKTLAMLKFSELERPYVVQLFGSNPEHFIKAVKIVEKKIKPDGIDINFGCPVRKVQKQGAGAILMDDLKLSRRVIKAVINNTKLPVSLKIRSQAKNIDALEFLRYMRDLKIAAVMIHGRTLAQGHSGSVNWQIIKSARKYFKGVILANGGVRIAEDAWQLLKKTEVDGIGIAQGALGRPWIFAKDAKIRQSTPRYAKEIFKMMLEHAKLVYTQKGDKGIIEMRKHLCWYVKGLPEARKLREKLVRVGNYKEIKNILNN